MSNGSCSTRRTTSAPIRLTAPRSSGSEAATRPRKKSSESTNSSGKANSSARCRSSSPWVETCSSAMIEPPSTTSGSPPSAALDRLQHLGVVAAGLDPGQEIDLVAGLGDERSPLGPRALERRCDLGDAVDRSQLRGDLLDPRPASVVSGEASTRTISGRSLRIPEAASMRLARLGALGVAVLELVGRERVVGGEAERRAGAERDRRRPPGPSSGAAAPGSRATAVSDPSPRRCRRP